MKRFWLYAAYLAGLSLVTLLWWLTTGWNGTTDTAGLLLAAGHWSGIAGTYAILWQLVLLSRLPLFDKSIGLEHVTWLHKWNGYAGLTLILAHFVTLLAGYGIVEGASWWTQFLDFLFNWEDVLKSALALVLFVSVVGLSVSIVRRQLKYETWYAVHLTTYLAILLAFGHQTAVGPDFAQQPLNRAIWIGLYVLTAAVIGFYRFIRPAYLVYKHRFVVDRVVAEADDVVSVYVSGRQLEELAFEPGQFFIWRFLDDERWWQAHPFSVSAAPNGQSIRLTAKELGDFTARLPALKPGTPVSLDGPHGYLTASRLTGRKLVMVAGGIGITPIRAMLEGLPEGQADVTVIYAARHQSDLVLKEEIDELAGQRGATVHYILSDETAAGTEHGVLDQHRLARLVPDLAEREMVLCGPPAMMAAVTRSAARLGLPRQRIYTERFAYDR